MKPSVKRGPSRATAGNRETRSWEVRRNETTERRTGNLPFTQPGSTLFGDQGASAMLSANWGCAVSNKTRMAPAIFLLSSKSLTPRLETARRRATAWTWGHAMNMGGRWVGGGTCGVFGGPFAQSARCFRYTAHSSAPFPAWCMPPRVRDSPHSRAISDHRAYCSCSCMSLGGVTPGFTLDPPGTSTCGTVGRAGAGAGGGSSRVAQSQLCSFLPSMQLSRKQFYSGSARTKVEENVRLFEPHASATRLRRQCVHSVCACAPGCVCNKMGAARAAI